MIKSRNKKCQSSSAEVFNGSLKWGVSCSVKSTKVLSLSALINNWLMLPGPAHNCMSESKTSTSTPLVPSPSNFPPHPPKCNLSFFRVVHLHCKHSPSYSQVFLSHLSVQWADLTFSTISLRGESGPRGHRFQCCQRCLRLNSGEKMQPS